MGGFLGTFFCLFFVICYFSLFVLLQIPSRSLVVCFINCYLFEQFSLFFLAGVVAESLRGVEERSATSTFTLLVEITFGFICDLIIERLMMWETFTLGKTIQLWEIRTVDEQNQLISISKLTTYSRQKK